MTDEEMFAEMEADARRLPSSTVKRDRGKFYPEMMTAFGQYEAGSPQSEYADAKGIADKLVLEAKEHMANALKDFIRHNNLRKAKP